MHRSIIAVAVALTLSACATPSTQTTASAAPAPAAKAPACVPAPTQLVKKDVAPGDGEPLAAGSAVLVSYTGWLYEPCEPEQKGRMFDTSSARPTPFGFVIGAGRVIKGWDEGVVGMKEGGKRILVIPASLGYGEKGQGNVIPPNAPLLFEVEVVKVLSRPPAAK